MNGKNLLPFLILFTLPISLRAFQAEGYASWYGGKFHGRTTANGEVFDTNLLTAAHKTLAFGSRVLVTNLDTGKSVIVRINDRGPFVEERIIDLSRAAADIIGLTALGVAKVRLEVVQEVIEDPFVTIQVASFGNRDNAMRLKTRLIEMDLSPSLETTSRGLYRVLLEHVMVEEIDAVKEKLSALGYPRVVVRK